MERQEIIQKACDKYIASGITSNITEALKLYLKRDATPEEQIPLFISSSSNHKLRNILVKNRPTCEVCEDGLFMQLDVRDRTGNFYPTAWSCRRCGRIEYSLLTQDEWLTELSK